MMEKLMKKLDLSARAYHKIIKIARTIADISGEKEILPAHIAEASGYRILDRQHNPL